MLYEEWKSRYKNLKNFNTVLQRCPRFWPLAPPRGMNPGVYSLGISEDPPRYLSSKFDASVRSDCWDISIWKTLTQCDGNGNANANANANVDDRGDYNSSPCTSYRRAKKRLDLRKVCARWVPHLLTEEQKTQCLKCAWELLKTYKGCNSRVISNLLTGNETWVHMFEPQRRADNKQWKRKDKKCPCIAKRTISSKKMLYAVFFNSSGPVVQVPCPSDHTVTGRFYKNSVLKKVKEFYNKKQPSKGLSGVHLLHDKASSHKSEVVKFSFGFWKGESFKPSTLFTWPESLWLLFISKA